MSAIKERLEKGVAMLDRLDQKRRETRSPRWGYDTEYLIVSQELRQIENDVLNDPCVPAPSLAPVPGPVPVRRSTGPRNQV